MEKGLWREHLLLQHQWQYWRRNAVKKTTTKPMLFFLSLLPKESPDSSPTFFSQLRFSCLKCNLQLWKSGCAIELSQFRPELNVGELDRSGWLGLRLGLGLGLVPAPTKRNWVHVEDKTLVSKSILISRFLILMGLQLSYLNYGLTWMWVSWIGRVDSDSDPF